jgi:hypothetical protein
MTLRAWKPPVYGFLEPRVEFDRSGQGQPGAPGGMGHDRRVLLNRLTGAIVADERHHGLVGPGDSDHRVAAGAGVTIARTGRGDQDNRLTLGGHELTSPNPEQSHTGGDKIELADPRALDILTTEHWSLLSARALGYQEMFARTTIFIAILSGTVVARALLAQATQFSRETLWVGLLMIPVDLFLGIAPFARSLKITLEDARWVTGMSLLRRAYLQIAPDLEPFFLTAHAPDAGVRALRHGLPQHLANLRESLTTTSGTVATLNSVLAGTIGGDISALLGRSTGLSVLIGAVVSVVSGALHVTYAARFRQRHDPANTTVASASTTHPQRRGNAAESK